MSNPRTAHPDPDVAALAQVIDDSDILGCGCCSGHGPVHPDGTDCRHESCHWPVCGGGDWPAAITLALVVRGHLAQGQP